MTMLCILTALSRFYGDDSNPAGSRAGGYFSKKIKNVLTAWTGVAFIFVYSFCYSFFFNSVVWVVVAEIFPLDIRGVGVGFAVFSQGITAIWLSYASSEAFATISYWYYLVFIGTNIFAGAMYYLYLPETNQLSLEEIAAAFEDPLAQPVAKAMDMEAADDEKDQARAEYIETKR